LMTPAGVTPIEDQIGSPDDPWEIPDWALERLKEDSVVWGNFNAFPEMYRRLKIGWITEMKGKSERVLTEREKRLNYLVRNTQKGKMYGTIPEVFPSEK